MVLSIFWSKVSSCCTYFAQNICLTKYSSTLYSNSSVWSFAWFSHSFILWENHALFETDIVFSELITNIVRWKTMKLNQNFRHIFSAGQSVLNLIQMDLDIVPVYVSPICGFNVIDCESSSNILIFIFWHCKHQNTRINHEHLATLTYS